MDAFTNDLSKIGLPTLASEAHFQQNVASLNVYSNVKDIENGANLAGGNIEFWPNNYSPGNSAKVPNASSDVYDFGDDPVGPPEGYGSMQVHNHDAKQTLFAVNHWTEGSKADIGIGNQPTANPDWTFAANAANYPRSGSLPINRPLNLILILVLKSHRFISPISFACPGALRDPARVSGDGTKRSHCANFPNLRHRRREPNEVNRAEPRSARRK